MKTIGDNPIWTSVNPISYHYPSLNKNIDCDVVIVGGGISGALCCYYFAKAGIKTVLLESNILGYSSSSCSTSILQYEIDSNISGLSSKLGKEKAFEAFSETLQAFNDLKDILDELNIDCDFKAVPSLLYTNKPAHSQALRNEYNLRKSAGFDVQYIDFNNSRDYFPFPIYSGILSHEGSGIVDPYKLINALIRNAFDNGARVFEHTPVDNIKALYTGVLVNTPKAKINAKKVIIATGYEAIEDYHIPNQKLTRSFTISTTKFLNENEEVWYKNSIVRDMSDPYTYLRPTVDGRILIGGEDIDNLEYNDELNSKKYLILEKRLRDLLCSPKDFKIEFQFNGVFDDTNDSLPIIGENQDFPNHYFCLGYGSNGILYSTFGAKMLLDLYLNQNASHLDLFEFSRNTI